MDDKTQMLRSLAIGGRTSADGAGRLKPRRNLRVVDVLGLALAMFLGAAGSALWLVALPAQPRAPETAAPAPVAVALRASTAPAAESQRTGRLIASGYVVARRKATVAAEVTGKVVDLLVDEGMVVEQGQVLARLDNILANEDYALARSRVDSADAALAAVRADLSDAERIFGRTRTLQQRSFASEADLTKAEARASVLRAQLRQAEAQLATAGLDAQRTAAVLDKHEVKAPFAGVVVERSAQPGEMISPMSAGGFTRTGICTIVDMDSIEVEVDVNEAFIGRVHPRTAVDIVLDAYPDWTMPGAVIAIVPTANREKATVKVRIGFEQRDPRILPDMAVKVTFRESAGQESAGQESAGAVASDTP